MPDAQRALTQSVAPVQRLPSPHLPHIVPPQSTSVSSPFWTRSVHEMHMPLTQRRLVQSMLTLQAFMSAQPGTARHRSRRPTRRRSS